MKGDRVWIWIYILFFAGGFLLLNPTQKAAAPAASSLIQKTTSYTATADLPVFPGDLYWDRLDDTEEDFAPAIYENSFALFPHWVFNDVVNRHNGHLDTALPYYPPYLNGTSREKYIFFRSIRI
ncbi:hypothetical protein [Niabella hirudinis]|uniref:hypothetical protein n=1 Tax=Niabella hirudinis TaxID=1285929 RepID=UPI003EB93B25